MTDNLHLAAEIGLDGNTAVLRQPSPSAPLDDGSRPLVMTQTDAHPDSQGQSDDHPATLDERALLTASENAEALDPSPGDPIPPPNIEAGATSPD